MPTEFIQLNIGWNAQPNGAFPKISIRGSTVFLSFIPSWYQFPEYEGVERITLEFSGCNRYLLSGTNDEGWYLGQCRFSRVAPKWGEFYEVKGDLKLDQVPDEWHEIDNPGPGGRHFLFYFPEGTFECEASDWAKQNDA